jgi:hypothetical protein
MHGGLRVFGRNAVGFLLALLLVAVGCLDIRIPGETTLFVTGTPFVLSGTATVLDQAGPCLVWVGDNGITYFLFQSTQLSNQDFDLVMTPGTTSRLELATRSDLETACDGGTIVQVNRVLEIVQ